MISHQLLVKAIALSKISMWELRRLFRVRKKISQKRIPSGKCLECFPVAVNFRSELSANTHADLWEPAPEASSERLLRILGIHLGPLTTMLSAPR